MPCAVSVVFIVVVGFMTKMSIIHNVCGIAACSHLSKQSYNAKTIADLGPRACWALWLCLMYSPLPASGRYAGMSLTPGGESTVKCACVSIVAIEHSMSVKTVPVHGTPM
jgi:hypothetical protein